MLNNVPRKWLIWGGAIGAILIVGGISSALGGDAESESTPTATIQAEASASPEPLESPVEPSAPVERPSSQGEPVESAEPEPAEPPVEDFWTLAPVGDGYALKDYIDESAASGDCSALQATFSIWAKADDVRDFTPNVLEYIDDALSRAGCY